MRRIIHTPSVTPDTSFGMIVAAVVLVLFYTFYHITWWVLLICIIIIPVVNVLTVGRTTRKEIVIDDQ